MTVCPDCGSSDLQNLGLEAGQRVDDSCTILISSFKCKQCECKFREIQRTEWHVEVLVHGAIERLLLVEPKP